MKDRTYLVSLGMLCAACGLAPAAASAQTAERLQFTGSLNLFLPTLSGSTNFPASGAGSDASVDIGTILENLKFTFMASLEAREGPWSLFTDLVYIDLGASKSGSHSLRLGGVELPAGVTGDARFDLTGWSWTLGGSYRIVATPTATFDLVGGARLLDIEQKLKWTLTGNIGSVAAPDRTGARSSKLSNWDAVVGFKGRVAFGDRRQWFVPYYLDVGAGDSDFTMQAVAGLGYAFAWGDLVGSWRYLDYEMKAGQGIQSLNFNGPMISAVFHW